MDVPASLLSWFEPKLAVGFVIVAARFGGMMLSAPFFASPQLSNSIKVYLAMILAILLFMIQSPNLSNMPTDLLQLAVVMGQELAIGLILGFVMNLVFQSVAMAGELLAVHMGLAIASALNPQTGQNSPIVGQLFFYFAMVVFLSLDLHHWLLLGVHHSYTVLPLGSGLMDLPVGVLTERLVILCSQLFATGLMLGAPVLSLLFLTEVALALVAKLMPQMNIFIIGLPLKVTMGLIGIAVSLPFVGSFLTGKFDVIVKQLMTLFNA